MAGDRNFANVVRAVKNYTGETVTGAYELMSISEGSLRESSDWIVKNLKTKERNSILGLPWRKGS